MGVFWDSKWVGFDVKSGIGNVANCGGIVKRIVKIATHTPKIWPPADKNRLSFGTLRRSVGCERDLKGFRASFQIPSALKISH